MTHLTYGDVQVQAKRAGLVMSRDRRTGGINLRHWRVSACPEEWRDLSLDEALAVIPSTDKPGSCPHCGSSSQSAKAA